MVSDVPPVLLFLLSEKFVSDWVNSVEPSTWAGKCVENLGLAEKPEVPVDHVPKLGSTVVGKQLSPDSGVDMSQLELGDLLKEMFPNQLSDGVYGHLTNGQLLWLQCYMQVRGHNLCQVTQDSNCLYNSVWCGLAMQSPHYKSCHLCCQVALFGMEYQYCVMDHVLPQLPRLYSSGEFFFPISFQEYLKYLL